MKLYLSPEAVNDLVRLREFLEDKSPRAAAKAAQVLVQSFDSLLHFPERGRISALAFHRELVVPFGNSAYLLRYRYFPSDARVHVVRVWHGREALD